ncbi:hypothetical protein, partial [Plasmodium yoelii yoelii]
MLWVKIEDVYVELTFGLGISITLHLIFYNLNTNLIYVPFCMLNFKKFKSTNMQPR